MLGGMAGGMGRRREGLTLAERAAAAAPAPAPAAAPAPASGTPRTRPVVHRHCWVQDLPDTPGRWPGLLVEWRLAGGWEGRVVYVVGTSAADAVVVEAWLPAPHLAPA